MSFIVAVHASRNTGTEDVSLVTICELWYSSVSVVI